jgi:hypothetical protein
VRTREQLYQEAFLSVDFGSNAQLKAAGLAGNKGAKKAAKAAVDHLFEAGYISESREDGKFLLLTGKGESEVERAKKVLSRWHGKDGSTSFTRNVFRFICCTL